MNSKNEKVLYFEGAGMESADISLATVGNCRIRTAFSLDDGRRVYLELRGSEFRKSFVTNLYKWKYTGFVDHCYFITDDIPNDDCNTHSFPLDSIPASFEYSFSGILSLVNSLGASFDRIEIINTLGGYRVFKDSACAGSASYNYGDVFSPDPELIENREKIYNYIYSLEKQRGEKYPCFSLWVDENDSVILHYHNFRKGSRLNCSVIYAGVPSDISCLPGICAENAIEGAFYQFAGSAVYCVNVYSISENYAKENDLTYLDRVLLSNGADCALPGSRVRS